MTLLSKKLILNNLNKKTLGIISKLKIIDTITSTNDSVLNEIKSHPTKTIALFAEAQTQGRGRLGRTWISPPHSNIYLSLSWHFQKPVSQLSDLSILVAKIIIQALKNYGITQTIDIKHPNDLMFENKKFGGILIETVNHKPHSCSAVIGIGLNVNLAAENAGKIDQPWTSLSEITHSNHDRNLIAAHLLNVLCDTLSSPQHRR